MLRRTCALATRNSSLPWRRDSSSDNKGPDSISSILKSFDKGSNAGRGRGSLSSLFSNKDQTNNQTNNTSNAPSESGNSLLDVIRNWKQPEQPKQNQPAAQENTVSPESVQEILGTFFSTENTASQPQEEDEAGEDQEEDENVFRTSLKYNHPEREDPVNYVPVVNPVEQLQNQYLVEGSGYVEGEASPAEKNFDTLFRIGNKKNIKKFIELEKEKNPNYKYLDLDYPVSPGEFCEVLNSPKNKVHLANTLGFTTEPNMDFFITPDAPPVGKEIENIWSVDIDNIRKLQDDIQYQRNRPATLSYPTRLKIAKEFRKNTVFSYHQSDEHLQASIDRYEYIIDRAKLYDDFARAGLDIEDHNFLTTAENYDNFAASLMDTIDLATNEKGRRHGKVLRELAMPTDQLYDENSIALDDYFQIIMQKKIESNPEWKEKLEDFNKRVNSLQKLINENKEMYGEDHEETLRVENELHLLYSSVAKQFKREDFDKAHLPVRETEKLADLPLLSIYQDEPGDRIFAKAFATQSAVVPNAKEYEKYLPNNRDKYFSALLETYVSPSEVLEHNFELARYGTKSANEFIDLVPKCLQELDISYEESFTIPVPKNTVEYSTAMLVLGFDYYKRLQFRKHITNYISSKLAKDVHAAKEELSDFFAFADQLNNAKIAAAKKGKSKQMLFDRAMEKRKAEGKYKIPEKPPIYFALQKKGYCDQDTILEQALFTLRKSGVAYTHHDIPNSRKEGFWQRFRAIYFNGSLLPEDKGAMVAHLISSYIVSADQLRVADGALNIMSRQLNEFEKAEATLAADKQASLNMEVDDMSMTIDGVNVKKQLFVEGNEADIWKGYESADFEKEPEPYTETLDEFEPLSKFRQYPDNDAEIASMVETSLPASDAVVPLSWDEEGFRLEQLLTDEKQGLPEVNEQQDLTPELLAEREQARAANPPKKKK